MCAWSLIMETQDQNPGNDKLKLKTNKETRLHIMTTQILNEKTKTSILLSRKYEELWTGEVTIIRPSKHIYLSSVSQIIKYVMVL